MKIALLGYGKMGKTIERLALEKGHSIVFKSASALKEGKLELADVAIEFSTPNVVVENISSCFDKGVPIVSGTTGWLEQYKEMLKLCELSNGSFIYASNFSVGVNLFFALNEYAAKLMTTWKEYTVSIEEIHHTQKKDAPSGTAISIADGIIKNSAKRGWQLGEGTEHDIEIAAQRIDDVKGTHMVNYTSEIDTISLKHEAHSRDGFALGAILAAEWLQNKKGVYSMRDVLQIQY
jgi:4-hydroxy-tetrahydrodipicolinate reductase